MARTIRHRFGQLTALAAGLTVALSGLVAVATPAAAATAPPWHWTEVTGTASLTWFSSQTVALSCPSGYVPISGGFVATESGLRLKGQHADTANNQYVFTFGNSTGTTQTANLNAWCVQGSEVGTITTVTVSSPAVTAGGRTSAVAGCANDPWKSGYTYVAVGADVEWQSTGSRTVEFASPDANNSYVDSWRAIGTSATAGDRLVVAVRCAPAVWVGGRVSRITVTAGSHTATTSCGQGERILNGGILPETPMSNGAYVDHGYTWASSPTRTTWTSSVSSVGSDSLVVIAVCMKTDVPAIQWVSTPSNPSSAASGQITYSVSDPLGEAVTATCKVDSTTVPCTTSSLNYGPVTAGTHSVTVDIVNTDGEHRTVQYWWNVDLVAPTVTSKSPSDPAAVGTTFDVVFSELVDGVDTSSFRVLDDAGQPVAGTVSVGTTSTGNCTGACVSTARFTPSVALSGHRQYTAQLTSGVHDKAGNSLVPISWVVTTLDVAPACSDMDAGGTPVNTSTSVNLHCSDADGDPLTYTVATPPSHGQLSTPDGAGDTTYTPDPGYVGADSFTFQAADGYGGTSSTATATLDVGPDHAPACTDVSKEVGYEAATSVSLSCTEYDAGQQLSFVIDSTPAHGGLGTVDADGAVTYTPYPGFAGQDSFSYHATDGYGGTSTTQTVTLNVDANAAPTCASKTVSVSHATAVSIPLSCTDANSGQTLTLFVATSPSHGSLSTTDGTQVTYKPNSTFGGTDSFTYRASDGQGGQSPAATVTLKVAPGATVLSLKAATLTLVNGKTDRLTGRLRDQLTGAYVNGRTVLLQVRRSTSTGWTTVAKSVTARVRTSNGVASFSVQPRRSCYYRVVFRATAAYRASASTALHIRVT
jgi:Bacterial Ig domain